MEKVILKQTEQETAYKKEQIKSYIFPVLRSIIWSSLIAYPVHFQLIAWGEKGFNELSLTTPVVLPIVFFIYGAVMTWIKTEIEFNDSALIIVGE